MIRSMSSALSGLRNHQVMLDVIGNDIANVSTVGFKGSSTVFSDVLTQTLQAGSAPANGNGGTNVAQVGLGSRLAGTIQSFSQGAIQSTGRSTDGAIQGDGFFVARNSSGDMYTRGGAFTLDRDGNLTTAEGNLVQGWQADIAGNVIVQPSNTTNLQIRVGELLSPSQSRQIDLRGNLSADAAIGASTTLTLNGYTDQGATTPVNITFTKTAANAWTASATYGNPATSVALTDASLTFDAAGELLTPADRNVNIAGGLIPGLPVAISINLGGANTPGRITQFAGASTAAVVSQDGSASGTLQTFNVNQQGLIVGSYSNGRSKVIGQLAIAVFANPQGLERVAGGWRQNINSGNPIVGEAGAGGRGLLSWGSLESSNVDLAEEFARLIIAQRGFQGNARVVSAADEVLQEVVNLRR